MVMLQTLDVLGDKVHPQFRAYVILKKSTAYMPVFTVSILLITGKKLKKVYLLWEPCCLHSVHGLVSHQPCLRNQETYHVKKTNVCVRKTMVYRVNQAK